jgi:hypothetical protein
MQLARRARQSAAIALFQRQTENASLPAMGIISLAITWNRLSYLRTANLLARREEIESRARVTPPPAHPKDLFVHPDTFNRINKWINTYAVEFDRVAKFSHSDGHTVRFNYAALEGGKLGLHFPPTEIKEAYRGIPYLIDSENGPCRPMPWSPPQANTELNLSAI